MTLAPLLRMTLVHDRMCNNLARRCPLHANSMLKSAAKWVTNMHECWSLEYMRHMKSSLTKTSMSSGPLHL